MATSLEFTQFHKRCALTIGYLEYLLFGGVIFGWADLVYVLKKDGIFYDRCHNGTDNDGVRLGFYLQGNDSKNHSCAAQDNMYDLAFTIASFSKGIAAFLVGLLLDWAGLRITRLIASSCMITGGLLIGFCSKANPYLLFPGSLLIGVGGAQIRLANFQIANLFPRNKATVMSVYNGAFCGSGAVFLILKYINEYGISHSIFFFVWVSISGLMLLTTFLLLPKDKIIAIDEINVIMAKQHSENQDTEEYQNHQYNSKEHLAPHPNENGTLIDEEENILGKRTFLQLFCTISFVLHLFGGGTLALGLVLYMGSFNWWITKIAKDDDRVSLISEIYGYCQLPMVFIAPIIGLLMDSAVKKALKEQDPTLRRKKLQRAGFLSLIIASVLMTSLFVCRLFSNIITIYVSLLLYTFCRPTMNSVNPGYLRIRFPQQHFNKLMGTFGTLTAIYFTLQYPLFIWMQSNYFLSSIFVVALLALTLINPLHLLFLRHSSA